MPEDGHRVCDVDELEDGEGLAAEVDGHSVALFRVGSEFYALGGECTHEGGPLAEGELSGTEVTCPWHGARFDLETGAVRALPAVEAEPVYEVTVRDGGVFVRVG